MVLNQTQRRAVSSAIRASERLATAGRQMYHWEKPEADIPTEEVIAWLYQLEETVRLLNQTTRHLKGGMDETKTS